MVIVTPDNNNNIVFIKGNDQISNGWIPCGGHTVPIVVDGAKLK
jgi:hypothetical protein